MLPYLIVSITFCVFILGVLILTSFAVLFASLSILKIDYSESQQSDILVTQGLFDVSLVTFGWFISPYFLCFFFFEKKWDLILFTFYHFSSTVILHSHQIFPLHKNGRRRIHGFTTFPNASFVKKRSWPEVNIFPASFNAKLKPDKRVFSGHALSNTTHYLHQSPCK